MAGKGERNSATQEGTVITNQALDGELDGDAPSLVVPFRLAFATFRLLESKISSRKVEMTQEMS